MPMNPEGDWLMNHFTVQLYALVERGLSGEAEPTRFELTAGLLLAVRQIERLQGQVQRLQKEAPEVEAPAVATAAKCKHEFVVLADGIPHCSKCNALKKANGRPKKTAGVPAAPRGEVRDLEDVIS
jgi:hypothetical protein